MAQKEQINSILSNRLISNITQVFNKANQSFQSTANVIRMELLKLLRLLFNTLKLTWQNVIRPIPITGINILGYLLNKLLLGPPCFTSLLLGGLIYLPNFQAFKAWVNSNSGWNIYRALQGSADNILGFLLGGGIGLINYLSHLITSIVNISRPLMNLLGSKGVFGPRSVYSDGRNEAVIVCFGLFSIPFVLSLIIITNAFDCILTFGKHLSLSAFHSIKFSFNLLGARGSFGARHSYQDTRPRAVIIGFGLLSAPIVIPIVLFLNGIDLIISGSKKTLFNKEFLKNSLLILLGLPIALITAIPAFMLRKTLKGLYNVTLRPLAALRSEKPVNKRTLLTGLANVISLGGYSALNKIFKAYTGYTYRFGFPTDFEKASAQVSEISEIRLRFKNTILLATKGTLHIQNGDLSEPIDTRMRPWLRLFYGFRSSYEKILKDYHDIFEQCVQEDRSEKHPTISCKERFFSRLGGSAFSAHKIHQEVLSCLNLTPGG